MGMASLLLRAGPLILLLAALTSPAVAIMIRVPDDYTSILYAINAASGGDTVAVAEGTYMEHITLKPDVQLLGGWSSDFSERDPRTHETVIDGGGSLSVVVAQNAETPSTVIDGFTIRGGYASQEGGGIHLYNSSPSISNNRLINNRAQVNGGAISNYGGSPIITGNFFANNVAGAGSAISSSWNGDATITGNLIVDNMASVDGHVGGAIWTEGQGLIESNTLDGNAGAPGSGISVNGGARPIVRRNIVVNGIGGVGVAAREGAIPQTSCNDVWNNEPGDYSGTLPGPNSFTQDPRFCYGPERFLLDDSPCAPPNSPVACGLIGARDVGCSVAGASESAATSTPTWLGSAAPNPFTTSTTIAFSRDRTGMVRLSIHDASGRLVARPFDRIAGPGQYAVAWDGRSVLGDRLPAGVYFYRVEAVGSRDAARRIVLVK